MYDFAPCSKRNCYGIGKLTWVLIFCGCQFLVIYFTLIDLFRIQQIAFWIFTPFWFLFSVLWFWSYFNTCWLDAGSVQYEIQYREKHNILIPDEVNNLQKCAKCHYPKPERTHHCSTCDRCYFRFDHHCPAVGNCIALNNMKSFMLFLFYSGVLLIMIIIDLILAYFFIGDFFELTFVVVISVFVLIIAMMVICFGSGYVPQICVNRTTLERIAGINPETYDAGAAENVRQIMGSSCISWFIPTRPGVSGFYWSGISDSPRSLQA